MSVALNIIDARESDMRRMAALAMQEALQTGNVEAAPCIPELVAIVNIDGIPVCRLIGDGWLMGDRRASETRALTEDEENLPHSRILGGYNGCGGLAWTPAGFLRIGHELSLMTETEAADLYNRLAVRGGSTPELVKELCLRD